MYTFDVVVSDGIAEDRETIDVIVDEVNMAPVLDPIGPQSVVEETFLTFTANATDEDYPIQALIFSLEGNIPTGASITPEGIFSWMPNENQGPDIYLSLIHI